MCIYMYYKVVMKHIYTAHTHTHTHKRFSEVTEVTTNLLRFYCDFHFAGSSSKSLLCESTSSLRCSQKKGRKMTCIHAYHCTTKTPVYEIILVQTTSCLHITFSTRNILLVAIQSFNVVFSNRPVTISLVINAAILWLVLLQQFLSAEQIQ